MTRIAVWALLGSMCAVGCGGSDETEDPSGPGATSGAGAGSSSSSASGGAGSGGATGSGGSGAQGGAAAGASGGEGGGGDPLSTACEDFPVTVTLGPTIGPDTLGAVLCLGDTANACRLTTNTYGDGDNPCPDPDRVANFLSSGTTHIVNLDTLPGSQWTFVSSSAGTIDPAAPYYVGDMPDGTPITAVIEESASGTHYSVAFRFDGSSSFTITTFEPVL